MLVRLEENVSPTMAPYIGDADFWNSLPSYTIPMDIPNGVAVGFNVKGPIDPVTGLERFVRFLRVYDIRSDTVCDRIDCTVDADHVCFRSPVSDGVTAEDDSSIVRNPDYVVVDEVEQLGPDSEQ